MRCFSKSYFWDYPKWTNNGVLDRNKTNFVQFQKYDLESRISYIIISPRFYYIFYYVFYGSVLMAINVECEFRDRVCHITDADLGQVG